MVLQFKVVVNLKLEINHLQRKERLLTVQIIGHYNLLVQSIAFISQTVALYMPAQIQTSYDMKYGESEVGILSEGIKNIIDDIFPTKLLMQSRVCH